MKKIIILLIYNKIILLNIIKIYKIIYKYINYLIKMKISMIIILCNKNKILYKVKNKII